MSGDKKVVKKVGILGVIFNLFLLFVKFIAGIFFKSQGLVADAVNSFGDVFSSAVTYVGGKLSEKPEDSDHEFGHGKAEYVASFLIGLFMIAVSADTLYNSIYSIFQKNTFEISYILVLVPIVTVFVKTILYIYTLNVGKKTESLLVLANSSDHINDIFLSFGVLIGIVSGYVGWYFVDGIVGIVISGIIIRTGTKIAHKAYDVLIDKSIDVKLSKELEEKIMQIQGINHIDSIKSKPTGDKHILVVKISVDPGMTVSESHKIAGKIRCEMRRSDKVYDAIVHVNPDE